MVVPMDGTKRPRIDGRIRPMNRKSQIIDVSTSLFREKGYHAASLDDVAERIGFTKPAIYHYFSSKEDILFEVIEQIVDRALQRMVAIAARPSSPTDKLRDVIIANTEAILENLDAHIVFFNARGLLSPDREDTIIESERIYTRVVRKIYQDGISAGEFLDIDPMVATSTILGASSWAYRWFDPHGRRTAKEVAHDVAALTMNGYASR